jgi:hypothetical protein
LLQLKKTAWKERKQQISWSVGQLGQLG